MLMKSTDDFEETVEVAVQAELNIREAAAFSNHQTATAEIGEVTRARQQTNQQGRFRQPMKRCGRCNSDRHETQATRCPARQATCFGCKKKWHFQMVCGRKSAKGVNLVDLLPPIIMTPEESWNSSIGEWEAARARNECENKTVPIYALCNRSQPDNDEIVVIASVGGIRIRFMADTGAGVSIINVAEFKGQVPKLTEARIVLKGFGGELIGVLGVFRDVVKVGDRSAQGVFYVVRSGKTILGRDTLANLKLKINCETRHCGINEIQGTEIVGAYGDLFEKRLGKVRGFEHVVKQRKNSVPIQQKVRRLPLTTREEVLQEIRKLEADDVIEQIDASEWVSAMVVVKRKDGRVRLCVDLRAVNAAIVADVFPLPHFEDLLTKLSGATVFSKMHCRHTTRWSWQKNRGT